MKKNIFILFASYCLLWGGCVAQSQFEISVGGYNIDAANCVIRTADGGYAIAGYTYTFGAGGADVYVIKLSSNTTLQWTRTVGGTGNDFAYSIIQTSDGGFVVAGYTTSPATGDADMYIVRLDGNGNLQWSRAVGGANPDDAYSIVQSADGGYAVTGLTWSFGAGDQDVYIVKLNSGGSPQWSRAVGGILEDVAASIIRTTDGGYAVAGSTNDFGSGGYDMYILKFSSSGTLEWSRTVGQLGDDYANSIIQTSDGGYIAAGTTLPTGTGNDDIYIVKLNTGGTLQWTKKIDIGGNDDRAKSIMQTPDPGYAVAGLTISHPNNYSYLCILKLDASGNLQWCKTGRGDTQGSSMAQTTDGYIIAGSFQGSGNGDCYIVKFDSNWNTCRDFSPFATTSGTGGSIVTGGTVNSSNPFAVAPSNTTSTGGTVTTFCVIGLQPISKELPSSFGLGQNYPNPFNPKSKIKYDIANTSLNPPEGGKQAVRLVIYDILGREVATLVNEQLKPGSYEAEWDASNYPSGVYYYKLAAADFTETKKMVLIK